MSFISGLRGYLHLAGSSQAPKHSEYEICIAGMTKFLAVKNAEVIDSSVLRVVDEKKPVFVIVQYVEGNGIWRFVAHAKNKKSGNVGAEQVLSSDIGAMLKTQIEYHKPQYIKMRIGDESYVAGSAVEMIGKINMISFDDVLAFCSEETAWENLRGRSYLAERERQKELSSQEHNRRLAGELQKAQEELERCHQKRDIKISGLMGELDEVEDNLKDRDKKLTNIPSFIRRMFSAE